MENPLKTINVVAALITDGKRVFATARGYSIEDLERIRKEKADKRGAFDKKIFLETVTENE